MKQLFLLSAVLLFTSLCTAQQPGTLDLDTDEDLTIDAPGEYAPAEYTFGSLPVRDGEPAQGLTVTLNAGDGLIFYGPAVETGPGEVLVECTVWCTGPDVGLALVAMNLPDYSMMANLPANGADYLDGWRTMRLIYDPRDDSLMLGFQVVSTANPDTDVPSTVYVDEITVTPLNSLPHDEASRLLGLPEMGVPTPVPTPTEAIHPEWPRVWIKVTDRGPTARADHAMVYDAARQRVVLFGGVDEFSNILHDTWEWDGIEWLRTGRDHPPARKSHAMVYDSLRGLTVLFGGIDRGRLGDTWQWDGATWTEITTATGITTRTDHEMAFDAGTGEIILYGGTTDGDTVPRDTWAFDGTDWVSVSSAGPAARLGHTMVYDSNRNRVILFGGEAGYDTSSDTVEWDSEWDEWTRVSSEGPGLHGHAMAYDSLHRIGVVFGGTVSNFYAVDDTHSWDGSEWNVIATDGPDPRSQHAMAYDPERDRLVLFGGIASSNRFFGDTWEFREASPTPTATPTPTSTPTHTPTSTPTQTNTSTPLPTLIVDLPGLSSSAKSLEMVLIPAGTFTMGSPPEERGRGSTEWPPHAVTLTQAFYLGKYEVTQAQWEAVMGSNPSTDSSEAQSYGTYGVGDDYPVYYVNWNDCQTFIDQLNGTGLGTFRLPTEAEWEYACRAGTDTRFSFGDALECSDDEGHFCDLLDEYLWWGGNNRSMSGPKEVGLKLPNPWGLYDMHGNMYEWCSDWWENPHARGPQIDPQGLLFSSDARVLRGGYWGHSAAWVLRSAWRTYNSSLNSRGPSYGPRLVREYP